MSNYKSLYIDKEKLNDNIQKFIAQNNLEIDNNASNYRNNCKCVIFGTPGKDFATVNFFFNQTGTTTIQWNTGKNRPLGKQLADYTKSTINKDIPKNISYSVKGITEESFDVILSLIQESGEIETSIVNNNNNIQIHLRNRSYQDTLTLTYYISTRRLQLQSRPLTCYKQVVFY